MTKRDPLSSDDILNSDAAEPAGYEAIIRLLLRHSMIPKIVMTQMHLQVLLTPPVICSIDFVAIESGALGYKNHRPKFSFSSGWFSLIHIQT